MPHMTQSELHALRAELNNDSDFVDDCVFGRCGTDAMQAVERATGENPNAGNTALAERLLELM